MIYLRGTLESVHEMLRRQIAVKWLSCFSQEIMHLVNLVYLLLSVCSLYLAFQGPKKDAFDLLTLVIISNYRKSSLSV